MFNRMNIVCSVNLSGLVSSVRRALASKLRGPWFKLLPGRVVAIIMCGAPPGLKLALS